MIIANLGSKEGGDKMEHSIDIAGQKKLAQQYVELWRVAHGSMAEYIADVSSAMYNNLSDSMTDFIKGTKSAKNVLLDFGNSVLNMIAKIAAQRLAASWVTGLLGAFGGGSSGFTLSNGTSLDPSFGYTGSVVSGFKFAKGGIVTAPTMAMIGEAGENEAVIPLNAENLAAIGGKGKGGNVTVNITNNTGSKVDAEQTTAKWDGEQWVVGVVLNAVATNQNGIRSMIKGVAST
jgi:lambda family phage tail tape measure protein